MTRLVGNRSEAGSYLRSSVREWAEVQQKFQARLLGALVSDDQPAPAPAPAPVSVSVPKKGAKA